MSKYSWRKVILACGISVLLPLSLQAGGRPKDERPTTESARHTIPLVTPEKSSEKAPDCSRVNSVQEWQNGKDAPCMPTNRGGRARHPEARLGGASLPEHLFTFHNRIPCTSTRFRCNHDLVQPIERSESIVPLRMKQKLGQVLIRKQWFANIIAHPEWSSIQIEELRDQVVALTKQIESITGLVLPQLAVEIIQSRENAPTISCPAVLPLSTRSQRIPACQISAAVPQ
jgi:hypothetical protein